MGTHEEGPASCVALQETMMKTQILEQAEDDRAMLAHCKSLLAFEQKGGFAMVEDADWVPSASLKVADSPSISLPVLVV